MDLILETLAEFCHKQWANWTAYLFSKCIKNNDGTLTIPEYYVSRWQRQIDTDYQLLSTSEQNSDMREAQKIVDVLGITMSSWKNIGAA